MKKIFIYLLIVFAGFVFADDIEVSQDTLLQNLIYGETADRILTFTNNTSNDVDALIDALQEVVSRKDELTQNYHVDASPDYVHNTFEMDAKNRFSVPEFVDQYMTK